jgi:hypothetical protein
MKHLIMVFAAASVCFAAYPDMEFHDLRVAQGRPFFTNTKSYNSYYLFGSPLGIFEFDSSRVSLELGYELLRFSHRTEVDYIDGRQSSCNDNMGTHRLTVPVLRVAKPERAFFQIFYTPDFTWHSVDAKDISAFWLDDDGHTINESVESFAWTRKLPMQRFGFVAAGQSVSGTFGGALTVDGYIGKSGFDLTHASSQMADAVNTDQTRTFMGFERLRLDFSSRVHQSVRAGVFFGITAHLDTLYAPVETGEEPIADRSFQMNIPVVGGFVNFNGAELLPMPVHSSLSLQYASGRFVHTVKEKDNRGGVDGFGNRHSIINDSLQFLWMAQSAIPFEGHTFKPGLLLGYSSVSWNLYMPDTDNDPFKIGGAVPFSNSNFNELRFGFGTGFEFLNYADLFAEYTIKVAALNYGSYFFRDEDGERVSETLHPGIPAQKRSRAYHRVSLGASTSLHNYLKLPVEITPRAAYFADGFINNTATRWGGFSEKRPHGLYAPEYALNYFQRITGFTLGVDVNAPEKNLGASLYTTFLYRSIMKYIRNNGFEMGLAFTYAIPGAAK